MSEQELTRFHEVLANFAFAATTGNLNLPIDHITELRWGFTFAQNGVTAPDLADVKGDIIDEFVVRLGGREICRLDHYDICHMQNLWFGETPQWAVPAHDNSGGYWECNRLPLSLDKREPGGKGGLRSLDAQFTVGALTDVDTVRMQFGAEYLSNKPIDTVQRRWLPHQGLPSGYHYAYQYIQFTPSTTEQAVVFDRAGADLLYLIPWSSHIPSASDPGAALSTDIDWLSVYVNDQPVYGPIHWEAMPHLRGTQSALDDVLYGAELAHYKILDFSLAPLPADNLDIHTASVTTTTLSRFIGVFMEP